MVAGRAGVGVVVAIVVVALSTSPALVHAQDEVPLSALAVVNADGGTFAKDRLVLEGVGSQALWFTERPNRDAGTFSVPELIRAFFSGQEPPNAALEFAGAGEKNDVAVVELSKPRYDRRAQRLTFNVRLLGDDPTGDLDPRTALKGFASRNDGRINRTFDAATVFIDSSSGTAACNLQIYNNTPSVTLEVTASTAGTNWFLPDGSQAFQVGDVLGPNETWDASETQYWNPPCGLELSLSGPQGAGGFEFTVENPAFSSNSWSCTPTGTAPATCAIEGNKHGEPLVVDASINPNS